MIQRFFAALILTVLGLSLPAAPVNAPIDVPFVKVSGAPGSVLNAPAPFMEDFNYIGTTRPAPVRTRYKIVHDNFNIYIGVIADEPNVAKMKRSPKPVKDTRLVWYFDALDINFFPQYAKDKLFKAIVTPDRSVDDSMGEDDNTGTETYANDYSYEAHLKFISSKVDEKGFQMELAFPIGAMLSGNPADKIEFNFLLGRTRYASGQCENLLNAVSDKPLFAAPRAARKLNLQKFDPTLLKWQLEAPIFKTQKVDGKLTTLSETAVVNRTGKRSNARVRIVISNKEGQTVTDERGCSGQINTIIKTKLEAQLPKSGRYTVRTELMDGRKRLLAQQIRQMVLDYQPISIKLRQPAYRNNIYSTQKIDEVIAEITLEENIGQPLEVTLTGPNTNLKRKLQKTQKVNLVRFPAANLAIGEYLITAGSAKLTLKKLPHSPGEVWYDKDGITYVDGKPFMPIGCFSVPLDRIPKGYTAVQTYAYNFKTPEAMLDFLDKCAKANVKCIMPPYMEFTGSWKFKYFNNDQRQGNKLSADQRRVITNAARIMQKHPAFLGYYVADEPEGWGHSPEWYEDLRKLLAEVDPYHPAILLNYGMDGMRYFHRGCDVLMPDCYVSYFSDGTLAKARRASMDFAKLALELSNSSYLVPEAFDFGRINLNKSFGRAPTFDEVRQQIFLGCIGNAKGILPYSWAYRSMQSNHLRVWYTQGAQELYSLRNFLIQTTAKFNAVSNLGSGMMFGIKEYKGKFAIIAVNMTPKNVDAVITLPKEVKDKVFSVNGENRSVKAVNGIIRDRFAPHESQIYVSGDVKLDPVDLEAMRAAIAQADKNRFKPGNLLAAGEITYQDQVLYDQGKLNKPFAKITASSAYRRIPYSAYGPYWLQDGIIETEVMDHCMVYAPDYKDKNPWIEIDFQKPVTVGRVVFYSLVHNGKVSLKDCRIINADNQQELAKMVNNSKVEAAVTFTPVKLQKMRIYIDRISGPRQLLSELEVYAE